MSVSPWQRSEKKITNLRILRSRFPVLATLRNANTVLYVICEFRNLDF